MIIFSSTLWDHHNQYGLMKPEVIERHLWELALKDNRVIWCMNNNIPVILEQVYNSDHAALYFHLKCKMTPEEETLCLLST